MRRRFITQRMLKALGQDLGELRMRAMTQDVITNLRFSSRDLSLHFIANFWTKRITWGDPPSYPPSCPQTEQQVAIQNQIQIYCSQPRSKAEIAEYCGYKNVKYFADQYLKPMIENGLLEMTIPDKPTSPNQKYVTVDVRM